jgi:putative membrane protein
MVVSMSENPEAEPNLGAMRTLMAANRTLMAWVRTSLSMLSFGFTIYKILEELQDRGGVLVPDNTPRNAGVFLAVAGTVAMVMGTIEYWWTFRLLSPLQKFSPMQPTLIMALLICISGIVLCIGITNRTF